MTFEIIIIAIFALAAMLAAILAVHNIQELSDTRSKYDTAKEMMSDLEQQNRTLRDKITVLERDLSVEITNSKMLERALLDTIAPEEPEPEPETPDAKERLPEGVATNRYDCEGFSRFARTEESA